MLICPLNLSTANEFVSQHHRHHAKVQGCKFCIGLVDDHGSLRGVLIAGRPVSRILDDGQTLEVTRCCTDGIPNGCSKLYATASKIGRTMGYHRVITYILDYEAGTSLKASGWICTNPSAGGGSWSRPSRRRLDKHPTRTKQMWIDGQKKVA